MTNVREQCNILQLRKLTVVEAWPRGLTERGASPLQLPYGTSHFISTSRGHVYNMAGVDWSRIPITKPVHVGHVIGLSPK